MGRRVVRGWSSSQFMLWSPRARVRGTLWLWTLTKHSGQTCLLDGSLDVTNFILSMSCHLHLDSALLLQHVFFLVSQVNKNQLYSSLQNPQHSHVSQYLFQSTTEVQVVPSLWLNPPNVTRLRDTWQVTTGGSQASPQSRLMMMECWLIPNKAASKSLVRLLVNPLLCLPNSSNSVKYPETAKLEFYIKC